MLVFSRTASLLRLAQGPTGVMQEPSMGLHQYLLDQCGSLQHVHSLTHFKAFCEFFHLFLGYFPCRFKDRF